MRKLSAFSYFTASLLLCAGFASAANNPGYDSWAKHKPGTSVTLKSVTDAAGNKSEIEMTYTLVSVGPEKVVVELKTSMIAAGNKMDMPGQKMDIPAALPDAPKGTPEMPKTDVKVDAKQSEETITIAGRSFKCHVVESNAESNGMKMKSKSWTSSDVPNLTVKMETTGEGAMSMKTSMELTKIELK